MLSYFVKGWFVVLTVIILVAAFLVGSFLLFEAWHAALFIEAGVILMVCISFLIVTSYGGWQDK